MNVEISSGPGYKKVEIDCGDNVVFIIRVNDGSKEIAIEAVHPHGNQMIINPVSSGQIKCKIIPS